MRNLHMNYANRDDSLALTPPDAKFADCVFFQVHRHADDVGLFVSRAYHGRLRLGDERIAISQRICTADARSGVEVPLDFQQYLIGREGAFADVPSHDGAQEARRRG